MSFGQQSGPPASAKQVAYLLALVKQAGHEGFRDARGPLGLTQRQARGAFTRSEASTLIDVLLQAEGGAETDGRGDAAGEPAPASPGRVAGSLAAARLEQQQAGYLLGVPADLLAAELRRRGWSVREPVPSG